MDMKFIKLEDGNEYYVIAETKLKGTIYYLMVDTKNKKNCAIRKELGDELVGLDNYNEFELVISKFTVDLKDEPTFKQYLEMFGKDLNKK